MKEESSHLSSLKIALPIIPSPLRVIIVQLYVLQVQVNFREWHTRLWRVLLMMVNVFKVHETWVNRWVETCYSVLLGNCPNHQAHGEAVYICSQILQTGKSAHVLCSRNIWPHLRGNNIQSVIPAPDFIPSYCRLDSSINFKKVRFKGSRGVRAPSCLRGTVFAKGWLNCSWWVWRHLRLYDISLTF